MARSISSYEPSDRPDLHRMIIRRNLQLRRGRPMIARVKELIKFPRDAHSSFRTIIGKILRAMTGWSSRRDNAQVEVRLTLDEIAALFAMFDSRLTEEDLESIEDMDNRKSLSTSLLIPLEETKSKNSNLVGLLLQQLDYVRKFMAADKDQKTQLIRPMQIPIEDMKELDEDGNWTDLIDAYYASHNLASLDPRNYGDRKTLSSVRYIDKTVSGTQEPYEDREYDDDEY